MNEEMEEHFWINPLRLHRDVTRDTTDNPPGSEQDTKERIDSFLANTQMAYNQLQELKTHMAEVHYPALNPGTLEIHGNEFLRVPRSILSESENPMKDLLHYLQKFGVALFQVIREVEEEDVNSEYYEKLIDARHRMVQILGALQLALVAMQMSPHDDVTYDMLPKAMKRHGRSAPVKGIRDYIVLRDYSKFLEDILNQKSVLLGENS